MRPRGMELVGGARRDNACYALFGPSALCVQQTGASTKRKREEERNKERERENPRACGMMAY